MARRLRRTVSLGIKLAKAAKKMAESEAKALVRSGVISRAGAKKLVKSVARYALEEKGRIEAFVKQEVNRTLKVARTARKKAKKKR